MNGSRVVASLISVTMIAAMLPMTAEASTNFDLRKKVIGLTGITNVTGIDKQVTRGEFASMLVNATSYRSTVTQVSSTPVFADVAKTNPYAAQIKIAADNGWMSGYLGGVFKPDQYITLQEAIRGVLALLGYTNSDFTGDQNGGRLSKYYYLELSDEIIREKNEVLTKEDCINLFYNMLCTNTKSGSPYCKELGYELTSDGEVNPLTIADNELKGPKVARKNHDISDYVPFSVSEATFYLDGAISSLEAVKQAMSDDGFVVLYYNTSAKTIWAYSMDESVTGRRVFKGEITGIYYSSSDVLTPSGVVLDGDSSVEYKLSGSEMQFAFSIYGPLEVGDEVILICETAVNSNGDETFTVIDYVEY